MLIAAVSPLGLGELSVGVARARRTDTDRDRDRDTQTHSQTHRQPQTPHTHTHTCPYTQRPSCACSSPYLGVAFQPWRAVRRCRCAPCRPAPPECRSDPLFKHTAHMLSQYMRAVCFSAKSTHVC
eukprot:3766181-Rhodomonas_salina.2